MSKQQLKEFFSNLKDRSITIKEDFTCCRLCGVQGIIKYKEKWDMGFCFYHNQTREKALETGELFLYWGSYSGDEINDIIVANAIVDEGRACGLDVEWSGFSSDAVKLFNLDKSYFKRENEDLSVSKNK